MTMTPTAQSVLFPTSGEVLLERIDALEARVQYLEERREVRTHAAVAQREEKIVAALAEAPMALTAPQIADMIGADRSLVENSCRKLLDAGQIAKKDMGTRTPHYVAVR